METAARTSTLMTGRSRRWLTTASNTTAAPSATSPGIHALRRCSLSAQRIASTSLRRLRRRRPAATSWCSTRPSSATTQPSNRSRTPCGTSSATPQPTSPSRDRIPAPRDHPMGVRGADGRTDSRTENKEHPPPPPPNRPRPRHRHRRRRHHHHHHHQEQQQQQQHRHQHDQHHHQASPLSARKYRSRVVLGCVWEGSVDLRTPATTGGCEGPVR
mmetsp:Transcript_59880/g.122886  ORF Transcript_59880/g.122886 Transcript_59880/m.122886 type:complete len:215 (-) Transcript_59880:38-682(-)